MVGTGDYRAGRFIAIVQPAKSDADNKSDRLAIDLDIANEKCRRLERRRV